MYNNMGKTQKKCFMTAVVIAVVMIITVTAISLLATSFVTGSYRLEAGKKLEVSNLVPNPVIRVFSSFSDLPDLSMPGDYQVIVQVGVQRVRANIQVMDTKAPTVKLREISVVHGNECDISEFVVSIDDATPTRITYVKEPNFSREGIQNIKIKVVDSSGNETEEQTELIVVG